MVSAASGTYCDGYGYCYTTRVFGQISFNLFAGLWAFLICCYLVPAAFKPSIYHPIAALVLDALAVIFWFAGFISLAVLTGAIGDYYGVDNNAFAVLAAAAAMGAISWYFQPDLLEDVRSVLILLQGALRLHAGCHSSWLRLPPKSSRTCHTHAAVSYSTAVPWSRCCTARLRSPRLTGLASPRKVGTRLISVYLGSDNFRASLWIDETMPLLLSWICTRLAARQSSVNEMNPDKVSSTFKSFSSCYLVDFCLILPLRYNPPQACGLLSIQAVFPKVPENGCWNTSSGDAYGAYCSSVMTIVKLLCFSAVTLYPGP